MPTRIPYLLPTLVVLITASGLKADTTGRVSGSVKTSDGKPVPNAVVTLTRIGMSWSKELRLDASGHFFQVGLEPKEFELSVSAPGFVSIKEKVKVPLGDVVVRDLVLLTAAEAAKSRPASSDQTPPESASIKAEDAATEAYNTGAGYYSNKDYSLALGPAQQAYNGFREAYAQSKDEAAMREIEGKVEKANRLLGLVLFNLDKGAEARPLLEKHLEKNTKDGIVITAVLKIARDQKDVVAVEKYQALIDQLIGPQPEIPYNEGVTALNSGNFKLAKESATKALKVKPDYADGFYLLGIAEFGLNNLKASKDALKKYLELAPTGSKAGEVKEMLRSF